MTTKVLVFSGYGLNCEEETKHAFELAGAQADIVHINDIIENKGMIADYQILAFPGGFSFGDDTGSGRAFANIVRNELMSEIEAFRNEGKLIIGICNGFQVLTQIGLLPGALLHNDSARFIDKWVKLKLNSNSPWLKGIESISLPIAHGEGKYYAEDQIPAALEYLDNPNGSMNNIAGITSEDGKVLGMMPHPERAIYFHQQADWTLRREQLKRAGQELPEYADGLLIFKNAVEYCQSSKAEKEVLSV